MKIQINNIIGLLAILGLLSSCCSWDYDKKDFEFTDKELNLFRVYKINDTIYFQSNLGNIDTITVLEISEEKRNRRSCFFSKAPYHNKSIVMNYLEAEPSRYQNKLN